MASPYPMGDFHLLFFASFLAHSGPGHGQTAKGVRSDGCFLHNRLPSVPLQKRENMTLAEEKALLRHFAFDLSQSGERPER